MPSPLITLTTDFGLSDAYVAEMKGAILAVAPHATIIDVTHLIPPQDVARGARVVGRLADAFPRGTIHIAVVDPGVGSPRPLIAADLAHQHYLAPNNGLLSLAARRHPPQRVHRLTESQFWRRPVSATFHGRDILAPVAGHWALGTDLSRFGPVLETDLVNLPLVEPYWQGATLVGEIVSIDGFGNLQTNISAGLLPSEQRSAPTIVVVGAQIAGISRCYSEQPLQKLLALIDSAGMLEIAVNQGNAAARLNARVGLEVRVTLPAGADDLS